MRLNLHAVERNVCAIGSLQDRLGDFFRTVGRSQ
jgi:hypothetical protein